MLRSTWAGDIVLVTHGDTGKMLIANARGWSCRQGLEAANLHNAEVVELPLRLARAPGASLIPPDLMADARAGTESGRVL